MPNALAAFTMGRAARVMLLRSGGPAEHMTKAIAGSRVNRDNRFISAPSNLVRAVAENFASIPGRLPKRHHQPLPRWPT